MARQTYFVVQPFQRTKRGFVIPGTPLQAQNPGHAERLAERLAQQSVGAVAFSRSGDPETGDFDDAVVLGRFGQIPDEALDAMTNA